MSEKEDILSKMEQNVKTNSLNAWVLAARPKTLTGASVPVMIGIAFAFKDLSWENFQIIPALLCVLFAFIMQIDANFVNDYFDCLKGNDDSETRLGPRRACSEGWITLPAMRKGLIATTLLACINGLPLIYYGGWEMILIGLLCVAFCFLYTTKLSYLGLGDLLVLVFFGIVPVCLTYYVILPKGLQTITWQVFVASLASGLVIDTLLVVNNYRDRENDKQANKNTLIVRIGEKRAEQLYHWLGFLGLLLMDSVFIFSYSSMKTLSLTLLFFYLFLHQKAFTEMKRIKHGKELNKVLGLTARNMFVFGLLATIGILLIKL
ncbi:1,4-dihydroxy-2-naphthoate octaprenyltransferase [Prevotella disiens JCM 6334 = ATCC 29426]|uniref:1,4-dihydroxy-2-naphthoate octaprenyltransferase n=3 Tax=Prevotella disiens TaxID=28130 RepID=A0A379DXY6_9BACT|nr:1,4-dihydroxy-2-naphthoate octaprenyltransferase [Prevotella disiens]ERJ78706.1 1,4-dihydroxy-2-naphthoate octaprenyltransferase [Prevotella disiens JCM 6334 = ATCC 29426]SUB85347.1 1,4-dihydroxy-2-naphthoate octaprenyltransferase [Prevotella disiens]